MRRTLLVLSLASLLAAGCTFLGQFPAPLNSGRTGSAAVSENPGDAARRKIETHLRAGKYAEALALIRAERGKERAALADEYLRTLQSLAAAADHLLEKDDPLAAGKLLRTLIDNYPEDAAIARRIGRSRQEFQTSLESCASRLLERGMIQYRANDLEGAIYTWKQILVFHSAHEDARKIIKTADLQLKKLRTIP